MHTLPASKCCEPQVEGECAGEAQRGGLSHFGRASWRSWHLSWTLGIEWKWVNADGSGERKNLPLLSNLPNYTLGKEST